MNLNFSSEEEEDDSGMSSPSPSQSTAVCRSDLDAFKADIMASFQEMLGALPQAPPAPLGFAPRAASRAPPAPLAASTRVASRGALWDRLGRDDLGLLGGVPLGGPQHQSQPSQPSQPRDDALSLADETRGRLRGLLLDDGENGESKIPTSSIPSRFDRSGVKDKPPSSEVEASSTDGLIGNIVYGNIKREASSVEAYVDKYWRDLNTRNGHELRRLALVIDLFVAWSGTSSSALSSPPFECMMRSFAAVFQADRDNDPNVLTVLEYRPKGHLLPSNMLRSVRKDAKRVKELVKSSAPSRRGRGGGRP